MFAPLPILHPVLASCQQEQEWNRRQLGQSVSRPALRLWTYPAAGVVLGCSQRSYFSADPLHERNAIDVVTRQAGGGAVLVGPWMLSASIVLPTAHPLVCANLIQSYRWIGELYASVLRRLGIGAYAIGPSEARKMQQQSTLPELDWACFGGCSPWEVMVGKKKIVGLAQARRRTGVLLVAGLLLDRPDWELLSQVMGKPARDAAALADCTSSCAEQAGPGFALPDVATPIYRALEHALWCADDAAPHIGAMEIY